MVKTKQKNAIEERKKIIYENALTFLLFNEI